MIFKKQKNNTPKSVFTKKNRRKLLELKLKLLNMDTEFSPLLERRNRHMMDWIFFMEKVMEYEEDYHLEEAAKLAVKYCIKNNILKEYFEQNSAKTISLLTEFHLHKKEIKRSAKNPLFWDL
jgi:hypothetical protein